MMTTMTVMAVMLAGLMQEIEANPIIVALVAVLALPGVTSLVVSGLRRLSDSTGIDPRVIVYAASMLVTGLLVATGTVELPAWGGEPSAYVGAWLAWAVVNAELARRVYELLLSRLPGLAPAEA